MKIQQKFAAIVLLATALAFTACGGSSGGGEAPAGLAIGDTYGGGKVAYILQPGDAGYDPAVQHGLIVATENQSAGIVWATAGNQGIAVPASGAEGTAIGTGLDNTNAIVKQNDPASLGLITYAAGLARAYNGGGYTDWYLPSIDELNKLYLNRVAIGGFADVYYWSSSEDSDGFPWGKDFKFGGPSTFSKEKPLYVRAVRSF